jgi:hypothetical protein
MRVRHIVNALLGLTLTNAKLIMLIRHGEKIDDDHTDLSPQGQARADCLIDVFGPNGFLTTPQKIYAQRPTEQRKSTRPSDTVTPLANSLGLEVDLTYTSGKNEKLAEYIYGSPEEVILVCWGNDRIPNIAQTLGISGAPEWKGKVFDDIWIITDDQTPFTNSNVQPYATYQGDYGLNMYVVKENVDQCMNNRLGISNNNDSNLNGNNSLMNNNSTNTQDNSSGAEMVKVSTVAFATILSTLLYFVL